MDWMEYALRHRLALTDAVPMWIIRQSSHLLALLVHYADAAVAHASPPPVMFPLPRHHVQLLRPTPAGELEACPATMAGLASIRQSDLRALAQTSRSHTPLGTGSALVKLQDLLDPADHRRLARARDAKLPTQQVLRIRQERTLKRSVAIYPCIFCGGKEEDLEELLITCERSQSQAASLCHLVDRCASTMPPADAGLFREMWRAQGTH